MPARRVPCVIALALAGSASASAVEFRIVERRGQTSWDPLAAQSPLNDNVLNLAVQARVAVGDTTNESIGEFAFNILMPGESETWGALAKSRISGTDGTYDTSAAQYDASAIVGRGGMAAQYTYLAGINPGYNGVINGDSGAWTQTPDQDIGLVHGYAAGNSLLLVLPIDPGPPPPFFVPLDTAATTAYFGANGNWIDLYHFNYTIASGTQRHVRFTLDGETARVFSSVGLGNGVWGPQWDPDPSVGASDLTIQIVPAPGAVAPAISLLAVLARRRRT